MTHLRNHEQCNIWELSVAPKYWTFEPNIEPKPTNPTEIFWLKRASKIYWNPMESFCFHFAPPLFFPPFFNWKWKKKEKGIQYFSHMFLMSHKILVRSGPILSENYNIWKSILCFLTFFNIFCDKNIQNDKRVPPCYFIKLHIRWASGVNQA